MTAPYRTAPPSGETTPRRPLRPLPLALAGTTGGAAAALLGAFVEHLATWSHGGAIGAVAGALVFASSVVAARARHRAADEALRAMSPAPPPRLVVPVPTPPPPRPSVIDELHASVRAARRDYTTLCERGQTVNAAEAWQRLVAAEDRLAKALSTKERAP